MKDSKWSLGPPGVYTDEVENYFSKEFQVLEKRELDFLKREMLFYIMLRRDREG